MTTNNHRPYAAPDTHRPYSSPCMEMVTLSTPSPLLAGSGPAIDPDTPPVGPGGAAAPGFGDFSDFGSDLPAFGD